jgi:hypothetical protein
MVALAFRSTLPGTSPPKITPGKRNMLLFQHGVIVNRAMS